MTNLNVDQIQAITTNSNVKVSNQSADGACEIKAATNDATLQLNCSVNSHGVKIKAPANSEAQNYTMILPSNNIAANKFLKVSSITGSGATAIGQLEFADISTPDTSSVDAALFTSGTVSEDRYSLTGSQGAGLQLVQESSDITTNGQVTSIQFNNCFVDGGLYRIIMKNIIFQSTTNLRMEWLDNNNSAYSNINYSRYDDNDDALTNLTNQDNISLYVGKNTTNYFFEIELSSKTPSATNGQTNWMIAKGHSTGSDYGSIDSKCELYASFASNNSSDRIHGFKIYPYVTNTPNYFQIGTKILVYKYNES